MMELIRDILIKRDGLSPKQADNRVKKAKRLFNKLLEKGEMPFDFCEEQFGLEPDYLNELMYWKS